MALACLLLAVANRGAAQTPETPVSTQEEGAADRARFRLGPLRFTPSVALTNLGINNNVFNEPDDPKNDTTAAFGPAVDLWLKMGPARLSGRTSGQYLYFKQYDSQRSWSTTDEGRVELPLGRVTPFAIGSYSNTRQRLGYEIDSYAHRRTETVGVGTDLELGGKTKITLAGTRDHLMFDDEAFLGVDLATVLNRTSETEQLRLRYKLTPLTTFVVTGSAVQDRFELDPNRDANSYKVLSGFEFKPFALIAGTASVGYRWFNPLKSVMPEYRGVVASVDAKYAVAATQVNVKVSRDLTYSFEITEPYYALTDVNLTLTQRINPVWDLVGRGGWQSLDYARFASALSPGGRVDQVRQYGGGIGFRLGRAIRLGFDTTYYRRRSPTTAGRDYEGLQSGVSITYGIQS